jgi:exosome complex component RRP41
MSNLCLGNKRPAATKRFSSSTYYTLPYHHHHHDTSRPTMPLDTSAYSFALLRVDGRRWNELRRVHAQLRTHDAADGSSYLEMGHTKVMCVVTGPAEGAPENHNGASAAGAGGGVVAVSVAVAGFSTVDRKRRGRNDKWVFGGSR